MEPQGVERKLTTILSADVEGYSRLMGADEEATLLTLNAYREVIDGLVAQHRGRVFGSAGDSILAEFASAVEALRCAVNIQRQLEERNARLPEARRMRFRIGVNLGDVMVEGDNLYGDGVNVAARLEGLAEGGGICVSRPVHDQVRTKLDLEYEDLGEREVKNIAEPVRAYRVRLEPKPAGPEARKKQSRLSQRQTALLSVVVCTLLGAAGVALWSYLSPSSPPTEVASQAKTARPLPDKPSIAVLPFENVSGDPEQEYFTDGMTEDIITALSRFSDLFVIARNSVFTYKGRPVKVQQVAEELGVRYVLEGSVRKAGERVRINAQLVDATTGHHLWAERFDRDMKDVFALQDEVTQKIVAALAVELSAAELERAKRKDTDNLEAYDYVLRGRDYVLRFTKETHAKARELFEKAIALDPTYGPAYSRLAWAHLNDWQLGWSDAGPRSLERAFELAQQAVALDDSDPGAHAALGEVYLWKKQYDRAIAESEKAVALNPNNADNYVSLADRLTWAGRPAEALEHVENAMRLNPNYPFVYLWNLGHAYFGLERYEEAISTLKRTRDRNPSFWPAHIFLAASYGQLGRIDEARAAAAVAFELNPGISGEYAREHIPYRNQADMDRLLDGLAKAEIQNR